MRTTGSLLWCLIALLHLTTACSGEGEKEDVHGVVRQYARTCYTYLQENKCDSFALALDVQLPPDLPASCRDDYRRQMADAAKQYLRIEQKRRGELKTIEAIGDSVSEDGKEANVTLALGYEDGATLRIIVPLRKTTEGWRMR